MDDRKLMATAIIGTVVAALCCVTPALGIVLRASRPRSAIWITF